MGNESLTYLTGNCVPPFFDASRFPTTGGFVDGRFCAPLSQSSNSPICCLPCPAASWTYSSSLNTYTTIAEWFSVAGLVLLVFMLLSYIALPTQKTRSHYLSVCLIIPTIMIAIGFTIPLATNPDQCYNEITPNDMYSSMECAWSGALVIAGGLSAVVWIFIRALSMNLQICWDIMPGRKFFYASQALGWGIPAALFTVTMTLTGVSFRFGNVCHVNHANSMADFWGPLLAFAGAAGLLQLTTFGYCLRVYLTSLFADQPQSSTTGAGSTLPSYSGSVRTQTARAVWRRLKKVLWLQWRGICIVTIILVDVIFFSIVFVRLDSLQHSIRSDFAKVEPWLECLAFNPDNRDACLAVVGHFIVNESTVCAVLFMLAMTGVQVFIFLTRPSIFPAWILFFRNRLTTRSEFVSLDAKPKVMRTSSQQGMVNYTRGHNSTAFEMQIPNVATNDGVRFDDELKISSPTTTIVSSPEQVYHSPQQRHTQDGHFTSPTYINQFSPDLGISGRTASHLTSPGSPPTPVVRYDSISLNRTTSPRDHYFTTTNATQQDDQRPGSSVSERRYFTPLSSFSAPIAPSRQSSIRSATVDASEGYGAAMGWMARNPANEADRRNVNDRRREGYDRF